MGWRQLALDGFVCMGHSLRESNANLVAIHGAVHLVLNMLAIEGHYLRVCVYRCFPCGRAGRARPPEKLRTAMAVEARMMWAGCRRWRCLQPLEHGQRYVVAQRHERVPVSEGEDGRAHSCAAHALLQSVASTMRRSSGVISGMTPNQAWKAGRAWFISMPRPLTVALPRWRAAASRGVSSGT